MKKLIIWLAKIFNVNLTVEKVVYKDKIVEVIKEVPKEVIKEIIKEVPVYKEAKDIKTFEIAGFANLSRVEYIIEAFSGTTGRIDIVPTSGDTLQITNIQLPAYTRVTSFASSMPLQAGMAYTAYLYLGNSPTPVASRPMSVA